MIAEGPLWRSAPREGWLDAMDVTDWAITSARTTRRHYMIVILSAAKDLAGFFAALRMTRYPDE